DGDTPFRWLGPTLAFAPPATMLSTDFNAGPKYLFVGQYGDPQPGPRLWRSDDGEHWQLAFGPQMGTRHIHGVAVDPYRAGHVWMAVGDGVPAIWRSTQYGAPGTW